MGVWVPLKQLAKKGISIKHKHVASHIGYENGKHSPDRLSLESDTIPESYLSVVFPPTPLQLSMQLTAIY